MSPAKPPARMKDLASLLPQGDELESLRRLLLLASTPDPRRTWSASGELDTAENRLVDLEAVARETGALADELRSHHAALHERVLEAFRSRASGDDAGTARALLDASALESDRGRHDRAQAWAAAAHAASAALRDRSLAGLALRRQGRAERALGQVEAALAHYAEACAIGEATGDVRGAAEAANGAGNVLEQCGRWNEAIPWYHRALEALGEQAEPFPEQWHAEINLHIVHRTLGQVAESAPWMERAEATAEELGDERARFFFENARGQLLMAQGAWPEAEGRFRVSLALAPAPNVGVTLRLNVAESLLAQGRVLDASEEARMAEAEAIAGGAPLTLPHVYRTLGRCAATMRNPDAFVFFERALEAPGPDGADGVERGMTLQAYALAEWQVDRPDTALDLLAQAARLYCTLGVHHFRRRWVDCFDVASTASVDAATFPFLASEHDA
jgi:tetratricopeptide (TPR) repeat protein